LLREIKSPQRLEKTESRDHPEKKERRLREHGNAVYKNHGQLQKTQGENFSHEKVELGTISETRSFLLKTSF